MKFTHIKFCLFLSLNKPVQGFKEMDIHSFVHNGENYFAIIVSNITNDIYKIDLAFSMIRKLMDLLNTPEKFPWIVKRLQENLGFTKDHFIRIRSSMKSPKLKFTSENYNLPHVDYFFPHETMIYYLNDSDGDTRIFDQEFTQTNNNWDEEPEKFTTKCRITPKANRLVWISGFRYHTASNPIESKRRVIININLLPI